ncbi:TonB-linked SusC/RagA family outer membrane protein [Pedobacter sp. AK013]|uniref:SusC/RagA family TonB-linked outer membrane protein n=1 Tax=Pedobacter sp. AK013 TaxID=2723071 RepID=UPI0017FD9CDF|nr:TonB-dependent receptor [Pedobacter sp. AK013]MBB6235566.1 TonB-linked SusC/RagA family outer membrane protein [Pedobacter sp. AK013]
MKISGRSWKDSHIAALSKTFLRTGLAGIFLISAILQVSAKNKGKHYHLHHHTLSGVAIMAAPKTFNTVPTRLTTIKGRVTDEKNLPLPGVSVRLKGTAQVVSTNPDGEFQVATEQRQPTLIFTYVGYRTQEVLYKGEVLSVKLEPDQSKLEEILVVGYGTQKKSDVLGSVATFNAKAVDEKPISRIEQALIGQMAGVQVRQQTGMPGAGLSIQVRGAGSITAGNEPLYVLDGFPLDIASQNAAGGISNSPLDNLNPNDIESVQVLKDAAAGAIYGSRAANGVVIITTKKGVAGRPKISVNAKAGTSSVSRKVDMLSADEWVAQATELANSVWVASGTGRTASQTNAERAAILGLAAGTINTSYMTDPRWAQAGHPGLDYVDWQDAVFTQAPYQNYEASASGGTENVNYFISGNYLNQNGTLLNSNFKNYGLRANVEANASKKLKFGINLAPSYSVNNAPPAEGKDNQLMNALQMVPVVESSAGLNTGAYGNSTYTWASPRLISPYAYLETAINNIKTSRLLASVYADYQIIRGLSLRSSVNYDNVDRNTSQYTSDQVTVGAASALLTNPGLYSTGAYIVNKKQNFLNENTLSYSTTIAGVHKISAIAGVSYNIVHAEGVRLATAGGFANDIIKTLSNAIANSAGVTTTGTSTAANNTLFSYYSRLQYAFKDRYLLSGTIRRDASSKFGTENRWGTFPSVSAGWKISEESFLKDVKAISELKLRLSWGKSGNNNIGDYNAISTLVNSNYVFGGNTPTTATGQVVSGLANKALKWETSSTYDLGLDLSLLANRINFTFDAYHKKNSDLLLNLPVLSASGFSTSLQNIGAVVNKGLEFGLNTVNLKTAHFTWAMSANIAFNKNTVTDLGPTRADIEIASAYSGSNAPYLLREGLPAFSYYITKTDGILTAADIANPSVAKVSGQKVGDAKYVDNNGDGKISAADRVVGGQPAPKYTWGWTNTFKYGDFDLGIQLYGQHGGSILSYLGRAIDFSGSTTANVLGVWRDHWSVSNPDPNAPRGRLGASYTYPNVTSDWVYSTDFLRVQNITLGYNLKKLFKTPAISSARIFVSLENYFSHDKYKGGANPEAQNTNVSGDGSYAISGDYGSMPLSKTASIGVNIGF